MLKVASMVHSTSGREHNLSVLPRRWWINRSMFKSGPSGLFSTYLTAFEERLVPLEDASCLTNIFLSRPCIISDTLPDISCFHVCFISLFSMLFWVLNCSLSVSLLCSISFVFEFLRPHVTLVLFFYILEIISKMCCTGWYFYLLRTLIIKCLPVSNQNHLRRTYEQPDHEFSVVDFYRESSSIHQLSQNYGVSSNFNKLFTFQSGDV